MPRSVELVLETVLSVPDVGGLADVTTVELQAGALDEHLSPGQVVVRGTSTIQTPNSEK